MMIEIDTHCGIPIYKQVVEQISLMILTGQIEEGTQLPTVRDMAARLNVNPMTVSKAYSLLEGHQLVERKRGIGLFVTEIVDSQKEQSSKEMLKDILKQAAVTAVQLKIPLYETEELLSKLYKEIDNRSRR